MLFSSSLVFPVFASTFDDVPSNDENYTAIEYLVSIGTLEGYDDGDFKPNQTINRAELMKVLVSGQGIEPDESTYKNCFTDVATDWYAKYVCYAKEQGWVSGYDDGTFKPAQTVNKVEAAKMIVNAYDLDPEYSTSIECLCGTFSDVSESDWFSTYLEALFRAGIITEAEEGSSYGGADEMTRGSVAEYIFRSLVVEWYEYSTFTEGKRDEFLTDAGLTELISGASEDSETYTVDRIVDGDTLVLDNGEYVRLLGVDAPEDDECFAEESTDHLESLVLGETVTLEADLENDDRDAYDRLLRYVFVDGENINLQMVSEGYAQFYDSYPLTLDDEFEEAESSASDSGLAIWEACFTENSLSEVVISTVFYDGEVYQVESDEYVEITNNGSSSVNLEGYYIIGSKGSESYTFDDVSLGAGESLKVYTNQGDYSFGSEDALWSNSGETVYLYDSSDNLVDSYSY